MKRFIFRTTALLISSVLPLVFAENVDVTLQMMQQKAKAFEYKSVIRMAEQALEDKDQFSNDEIVQLYRFKGIAHYSETEMNQALQSFVHILKIDPNYSLDPLRTSPKIVTFFNEIKDNLHQPSQEPKNALQETEPDTVKVVKTMPYLSPAALPSMIFPGTGHWLSGHRTKGRILTALNAVAVGLTAASVVNCYQKRDDYLRADNPDVIGQEYSEYNKAYKTRNNVLIAYSAFWLYTQLDLFFISGKNQHSSLTFQPTLTKEGTYLSCHIKF